MEKTIYQFTPISETSHKLIHGDSYEIRVEGKPNKKIYAHYLDNKFFGFLTGSEQTNVVSVLLPLTLQRAEVTEPDGWLLNGEFSVHKPKELMNPIFKPQPVYFSPLKSQEVEAYDSGDILKIPYSKTDRISEVEAVCEHDYVTHPSHPKIGALICVKCNTTLA